MKRFLFLFLAVAVISAAGTVAYAKDVGPPKIEKASVQVAYHATIIAPVFLVESAVDLVAQPSIVNVVSPLVSPIETEGFAPLAILHRVRPWRSTEQVTHTTKHIAPPLTPALPVAGEYTADNSEVRFKIQRE